MKGSFNYTGRTRLLHIGPNRVMDVNLVENEDKTRVFQITFHTETLNALNFPADANILTDVWRYNDHQLFSYGMIGQIQPPPHTSLSEFPPEQPLNLRVMVKEGGTSRLLGSSAIIRLTQPYKDEPLLYEQYLDLGELPWKLILAHEGTTLALNKKIHNEHPRFYDGKFRMTVIPAVLFQILERIGTADRDSVESFDEDSWERPWLTMLNRHDPNGDPQNLFNQIHVTDAEERHEVIQGVIDSFTKSQAYQRLYKGLNSDPEELP